MVDLGAIDALLDELGCDDEQPDEGRAHGDVAGLGPGSDADPVQPSGTAVLLCDGFGAEEQDTSAVRDDNPWPDPHELVGPVVVPQGYWLDGRQVLRYVADNSSVPGARLVTLARRYRFDVRDGRVWVPRWLARRREELGWVLDGDVGARDGSACVGGRAVEAAGVDASLWQQVAQVPYAVWAPELAADAMWDMAAVARALDVSVQTVSTYLSRGQMPGPQARSGRSPLWSAEVIWRWHLARPGQGRTGDEP